MLFCKLQEKWNEGPYADAFMTLQNNYDLGKKCKLMNMQSGIYGIYVLDDNEKSKDQNNCFMRCGKEKRCLEAPSEEDMQMLMPVAASSRSQGPSRDGDNEPSLISSRTRGHKPPAIQAPLRL